MKMKDQEIEELIVKAREVCDKAYAPYSRFAVGAALMTADGSIFTGCNVENSSYGLTICAERNAIFNMVAEGHKEIKAIAIYTPTPRPYTSCGACRQTIWEFSKSATLISVCDGTERVETSIGELFPLPFSK
jgi:cytidine deaminase